eukprot:5308795-Pyramimonas_sp.AAC.1
MVVRAPLLKPLIIFVRLANSLLHQRPELALGAHPDIARLLLVDQVKKLILSGRLAEIPAVVYAEHPGL